MWSSGFRTECVVQKVLGRLCDQEGSGWSLLSRGLRMEWVVKRDLYKVSGKEGSL